MTKLTSKNDIRVLLPNAEDLQAGAHYAAVSLPWTFNRMMYNMSSAGQQKRALNIAKGIVGQEMLKRELKRVGIQARTQRKSYRDEDLFDFDVDIGGKITKLDLKSINYYTNYTPLGRERFSPELLLKYAGYAGDEWRTFFPMLVPHTQIKQSKEAYCFAVASSIDLRNDTATDRSDYALTAFPYGEQAVFLSSGRMCLLREKAAQGIYLELAYKQNTIFGSKAQISVIGEWAGQPRQVKVDVSSGTVRDVGTFSCVSSFRIDKDIHDQLDGEIYVSVMRNDFNDPILNTVRRNINIAPVDPLKLTTDDFCNLHLPDHYTLYVVGWIHKEEFLRVCRQYTGWVWPKDSVYKFKNQSWTTITEADETMLNKAGFGDAIQASPKMVNSGWLKATGRGNGACCYVFPNVPRFGGVSETNLYVLPQDLYTLDTLGGG